MACPPEQSDASQDPGREDLARLMAQYAPALRRYFSRRAQGVDAEDLVQDVFLRLQARGAGEPIENVQRYLFRTAKHVLINRNLHERTDGLWRHADLETAPGAADDISPERIVAGRQDLERAVIALLNLPPRARAVFEFHRFEKLSYSAIAARMGISKQAVQRLMQKALERFADELGEQP